jgi:hypothetical protein
MEKNSSEKLNFHPENFCLTAECGKNFFCYLKKFDLLKEEEVLILYPNSHFYYDEDDLKGVRTLIILKKLNLIKDLEPFLRDISLIFPPNVNFVGCFSDSKILKWNVFISELSTRFFNFLDSRTDNSLDKKVVSRHLQKHGFKVIDMTEINGLTFFYSNNGNKSNIN